MCHCCPPPGNKGESCVRRLQSRHARPFRCSEQPQIAPGVVGYHVGRSRRRRRRGRASRLRGDRRCLVAPRSGLPQQVVDQDLRVYFFLNVKWRRLDDQIGPVLLIFAAPDELRVEVAVTPLIGEPIGALSCSSLTGSSSGVGMFRRLSLCRTASTEMSYAACASLPLTAGQMRCALRGLAARGTSGVRRVSKYARRLRMRYTIIYSLLLRSASRSTNSVLDQRVEIGAGAILVELSAPTTECSCN